MESAICLFLPFSSLPSFLSLSLLFSFNAFSSSLCLAVLSFLSSASAFLFLAWAGFVSQVQALCSLPRFLPTRDLFPKLPGCGKIKGVHLFCLSYVRITIFPRDWEYRKECTQVRKLYTIRKRGLCKLCYDPNGRFWSQWLPSTLHGS